MDLELSKDFNFIKVSLHTVLLDITLAITAPLTSPYDPLTLALSA